jgi:hypothetical protein
MQCALTGRFKPEAAGLFTIDTKQRDSLNSSSMPAHNSHFFADRILDDSPFRQPFDFYRLACFFFCV